MPQLADFITAGHFSTWIWAFASPILAVLVVGVLYQLFQALIRVNRLLEYADHVRELLQSLERWPMMLLKVFLGKK